MISTEQVKQAIEDCKKAGHEIGIRDIAYVFLSRNFDDIRMPYRCLFGLDVDYNPDYAETYDKTGRMEYLKGYVETNFSDGTTSKKRRKKSGGEDVDISFEENKAEIIKLIQETKDKEASGELDAKESLNMQTKLRVALNDKFGAKEDVKDQVVIVNQKYDDLCPNCFSEVARRPLSKQEAMEMYNLVERTETE